MGHRRLRRLNGMFAVALLDERAVAWSSPGPFRDQAAGQAAFGPIRVRLGCPQPGGGWALGRADRHGAIEEYAAFHYVPPPRTGIEDIGRSIRHRARRSFDGSEETVRWAGSRSLPTPHRQGPRRASRSWTRLSRPPWSDNSWRTWGSASSCGGVDSRCCSRTRPSRGARPRAFTISFPGYGDYDERLNASRIAGAFLGFPTWSPPSSELRGGDRAEHPRPLIALSAIRPPFRLLQLASLARHYVTVVRSDAGGDELFGGYYSLRAHKIRRIARGLVQGVLPPTRMGSGVTHPSHRRSRAAMMRSYLGRLTGASTNDDVEQYLDLVARSTSPRGLGSVGPESRRSRGWRTSRMQARPGKPRRS